jgi:hypothetical protein
MHSADHLPPGTAAFPGCVYHRNVFCVPGLWQRVCLRLGKYEGHRSRAQPGENSCRESGPVVRRQVTISKSDRVLRQWGKLSTETACVLLAGRGFLHPGFADGISQRVRIQVARGQGGSWSGKMQHSYGRAAILSSVLFCHSFPV